MSCHRRHMFFIHRFSNGTKVINKGHLELFSLPNVHYTEILLNVFISIVSSSLSIVYEIQIYYNSNTKPLILLNYASKR
ncbi:hypothetical protein ETF27_08005 [Prevotella brunnea]|uniref:Uncharacterized protein n=1 Tax=Prevotella brunnea TaxID=2508867 RepID=A0A5C8GGF9_9BACT|nr:hypothetical protein ETF27_08005 [Prevotella brunnea]